MIRSKSIRGVREGGLECFVSERSKCMGRSRVALRDLGVAFQEGVGVGGWSMGLGWNVEGTRTGGWEWTEGMRM